MGIPIYIKVEKEVYAPINRVWKQVAAEFGNVCHYNPEIKDSKLDTDTTQGVGTIRHCEPVGGGFLKEKIIEWKEMENFKLKVIETSFPMSIIESKFQFKSKGDNTIVTQEFWYRMKFPLGWMSGLMKGKMRKTLIGGLDGLDYYLANNRKLSNGS